MPSEIQLAILNLFCEHYSPTIKILSKSINFTLPNVDTFTSKTLCSKKERLNCILIEGKQNCVANVCSPFGMSELIIIKKI
jgi:hypothetical protein